MKKKNINKIDYKKSDTIVISDLHMGSETFKAEKLYAFLSALLKKPPHRLIVNGDAFEFWSTDYKEMGRYEYKCIRKAIELSENGVKLVFIPGNHDRAARGLVSLKFGKIKIRNEYIIKNNGKKFVVLHGDEFDALLRNHVIVSILIGRLYYILVKFAAFSKRIFGYNTSIANQKKSKRYMKYVNKIKRAAIAYAASRKADGIIIGHTHYPEIFTNIDGIVYANSGDWTESCSFVIVGKELKLDYFR